MRTMEQRFNMTMEDFKSHMNLILMWLPRELVIKLFYAWYRSQGIVRLVMIVASCTQQQISGINGLGSCQQPSIRVGVPNGCRRHS